jgi:hypothetical protein
VDLNRVSMYLGLTFLPRFRVVYPCLNVHSISSLAISSAFLQAPTAEMNTEESVHTLPDGLDLYAKTWKVCLNLQDTALIPIGIS